MKKYISILLVAVFFSSCESELELTSPSELTAAGFWDSENGARAAHTGLYGTLRGSYNNLFLLGEMRSDIWGGPTFETPDNLNLIESNITTTTAPFGGWAGLYGNIHKVNDFLKNIPNISFTNQADKNHFMGQAYGLRALYYYTLLKTWGDVPISLEPVANIDPSALGKARSSQNEVMTQIKADIAASLNAFGSNNSFYQNTRVYWSKAATLALKGDVYIWSGNLLGGGAADFNEAKAALQQIASLDVSLVPSSGLWGVANENNKEFIFALQYKQNEASNIYNSFTGRGAEIHQKFDDKGNILTSTNFVIAGANRYGQSVKTILLLDDNKDSRKDLTFIRLYKDNLVYPTYNATKYFGNILNKFLGRVAGTERIFENDVPIYRYADVVLLLAEAKNLLNEDPSGEINLIRKRAYGDANYNADPTLAYVNGTKLANANAILNERYKEFIGEGKRWWDLRRAGNSFVYNNVSFLTSATEYKLLLPITSDMIGRNPLLVQTIGYPNN